MIKAAPKKNGFTLLELLVVISIMVVVTTSIGAGMLYLQNAMRLDNSIRDLKAEVQSTQNLARNSFFSNATSSTVFRDVPITAGWLLTFSSTTASDNISIVKRSIYFVVPASASSTYDYTGLRTDILGLRSTLTGDLYSCDNTNKLVTYSSGGKNVMIAGFPVMCSDSSAASKQANEYVDVAAKNSVILGGSNLPIGSIKACGIPSSAKVPAPPSSSNPNPVNIFFTAGYGEPASGPAEHCQIQIKAGNGLGSGTRAIKLNKDTGGVSVCGNYCTP